MGSVKMRTRTVWTRGINDAVADDRRMAKAVLSALGRFNRHDWGKLCDEDKALNDADLRARDGRVLAKYPSPQGDMYVIRDFYPDYDLVTVLFCNEY